MAYTDPALVNDETTLAEQYLDTLADQHEDWEPHDGQLEPPIAEATAVVVAPVVTLLKDETTRADYEGWGKTILGIARTPAVTASSTVAVVMESSTGHTMPAGTRLVGTSPTGDELMLVTLADAVTAIGETTATGVPVAADEPGAAPNGTSGTVQLWDAYEFVRSVALEAPLSAGADEQDRDDYNDKLARRVRRFLGIPATVADMAAAATDVAGVERAIAVGLLDPANPGQYGTDAAEGHVTVFAIDSAGEDVNGSVAATIIVELTGPEDRLLNVKVHTGSTTDTNLVVTFTATAAAGYDDDVAIDAGEAAVAEYLSKANWGRDEDAPGLWRPIRTVHYHEVAQAIQEAAGIDILKSLTINGAEDDIELNGFAPLPNLTSVVGTPA